ncbi:hypothetical protein GCM10007086_30140 [Photobacterium aphoticum]|nr:hypothetical protein C9I90_12920 [Photobacterium aphoticum]GHA53988.1 hypothetical protein GCM10007086_30140 [Photobacterium aphoticum]
MNKDKGGRCEEGVLKKSGSRKSGEATFLWTYGPMDLWTYGPMDLWTYGPMDLWTYGINE